MALQQGPDSPVLSLTPPLQCPSAALELARVSSPLVPVPTAALPWHPTGLRLWQQRSSCWLRRNKADDAPCCSFSLEELAPCSGLCCAVRWEPTSCSKTSSPHFPGVGGCWLRGSWPAWHGQALPCPQLVPPRGEGVPGPLPAPRQCQRCMGRQTRAKVGGWMRLSISRY